MGSAKRFVRAWSFAFVTDTRMVTVVKPGDAEFLDQFDLSQATVSIQGEDFVVNGVIVRDKASHQQKQINVRFRWFESSQSFGMTQAETVAILSSLRSALSAFLASLPTSALGWLTVDSAQATPGLTAFFESPVDGQAVAGVALVRGWAFLEASTSAIQAVRLLIDGQPGGTIPCCSGRGDVASAFPTYPNAFTSGWGTVLNYGLLSAGVHTFEVQITDSAGGSQTVTHSVTSVRPGDFEFLDQFDFSQATAQIVQVHPWAQSDNAEIRLTGVQVRDKATQQTKVIDVHLRWSESAQGLGISAASD
jgi:hypothetical protein